MDWLAKNGLRFSEAFCQSPVCGSSRMSFYTGRYPSSHGAQWNGFPLKVGEMTLGDHLRKLGMDSRHKYQAIKFAVESSCSLYGPDE
jgi:arylsulfatase A-like enzyme